MGVDAVIHFHSIANNRVNDVDVLPTIWNASRVYIGKMILKGGDMLTLALLM